MLSVDDIPKLEKQIYNTQFNEVIDKIQKFREEQEIESTLKLKLLLLLARTYCYKEEYRGALEIAKEALELSEKVTSMIETIDALIILSHGVFLGDLEGSKIFIYEEEKKINLFYRNPDIDIPRVFSDFLIMKFIILRYTGNLEKCFGIINYWRKLFETNCEKIDLSFVYMQLSESYLYAGKADEALLYSELGLKIQKELNNEIGIASSLYFVGQSLFVKGEIKRSIKYYKKIINITEKSTLIALETTHMLASVYRERGDVNRALRYYDRAVELAEKEGYVEKFASLLMGIGTLYRMKGESNTALEYLNKGLNLCREINSLYGIAATLFYITLIYLDKGKIEQAKTFLPELESIAQHTKSSQWKSMYLLAKALILKKPKRLKSRSEAEKILKEIIQNEPNLTPHIRLFAVINLCDLLLEELSITNNNEILKEINPLINLLLEIAQTNNSHLWFAETKFLQAKLALIQMDILKAKKKMIQAQMIAEMHSLNLLAIKISNDHDSLLDQSKLWDELSENEVSYSERIKLASIDGLISQMQGKNTFQEFKITDEEPILLLIMSKDGIPHFNHTFRREWDHEYLFSSFLSAFNSFSSEIFSKTIDRIKIGEHKILINPLNELLVCYVIRGQSYPAQRKLFKFSKEIENDHRILEDLNESIETCRMLQLVDSPSLNNLLRRIFPFPVNS